MKLRYGIIFLVFIGLPAAFLALTGGSYAFAALGEYLSGLLGLSGGGAIFNILSVMLVTVLTFAGLLTLADRKWGAAMQDRMGPNRANIGPFKSGGLPHFLADAAKMLFKEDFIPERASKLIFWIAPAFAFVPVVCIFAVVPVAPAVVLFGQKVALQVFNPDFGILYVFACASIAIYGTTLAGWASNNKLALLGGVRASSQMISYEVALGLSIVGLVLTFSTLRLDTMVGLQGGWIWSTRIGQGADAFDLGLPAWGIFLQPVGFLLFFIASFAETKRPPFDLPEGESEIVGYFVEYSGMRFGLFMISEYVEVVVLAGVLTALFFGGYHLPFGETWLAAKIPPFAMACLLGMVFWLKTLLLVWLQLLIRWAFPRFRYDQIQNLGWRILLPAGLLNVFATGVAVLAGKDLRPVAVLGLCEIAVLLLMMFYKRAPAPAAATEPAPAHH